MPVDLTREKLQDVANLQSTSDYPDRSFSINLFKPFGSHSGSTVRGHSSCKHSTAKRHTPLQATQPFILSNIQHMLDRLEEEMPHKDNSLASMPRAPRDQVVIWLRDTFCLSTRSSLPKQVVYDEYCNYCRRNGWDPASTASCGRLVHQGRSSSPWQQQISPRRFLNVGR